jgi:hypothetical protein
VTIVPVLEEVLFVEKRLVLKEELHIRRQATTETVEVPVTLRKQRAIVERVAGENFNDSRGEHLMAFESSSAGNRTVTAFFEDRSAADNAVARLISAGVSRNNVRLVQGEQPGGSTGASMANTSSSQGGFMDALKDLFMPDEDRYTYAEGLRRGGYLVTVTAGTADYDRVLDILMTKAPSISASVNRPGVPKVGPATRAAPGSAAWRGAHRASPAVAPRAVPSECRAPQAWAPAARRARA